MSDKSLSNYSGKFGEDFKHHLVSTEGTDNVLWWNWFFKYRWQSDLESDRDTSFNGIANGSKLKDKCEEAYKKDSSTEIYETSKDKYEKFIWRYCSLEGRRPSTLKESSKNSGEYSEQSIGKKHEGELVSLEDPANNRFWSIQEGAFFKPDGLGAKATEDGVFKALYQNKASGGTLRNVCQDVYKKTETENEKDKKYALIFCSIHIKKG